MIAFVGFIVFFCKEKFLHGITKESQKSKGILSRETKIRWGGGNKGDIQNITKDKALQRLEDK